MFRIKEEPVVAAAAESTDNTIASGSTEFSAGAANDVRPFCSRVIIVDFSFKAGRYRLGRHDRQAQGTTNGSFRLIHF